MPTRLPDMPSFRLDGQRALITGGGRGIGRAAAAALAGAGAEVTVAARTAEAVHDTVDAIRSTGGSAEPLVLDVTDHAATDSALAARPPFDILVNNAGSNRPALLEDVTRDDLDRLLTLNVSAAFWVARTVALRLVDAGQPGSIINLSSQLGHVGSAKRTVYCATKFAVEGFTKAMAIELGPKGIRVNTICPTYIETPLTEKTLSDQDFRHFVTERIQLRRIGRLEDIMGAVVFLASDASALVTGSALMLDGGWTAE